MQCGVRWSLKNLFLKIKRFLVERANLLVIDLTPEEYFSLSY